MKRASRTGGLPPEPLFPPEEEDTSHDETPRTQAAGCVCWRPGRESRTAEVMLVRDEGTSGWGWPREAAGAHETLPECACRSGAAGAGAPVVLGRTLVTVQHVPTGAGVTQTSYWAARVHRPGRRTAAPDGVRWVATDEAESMLTRPEDAAPLDALREQLHRGVLDTRPVLVLRHARARPRDSWSRADSDRPLVGAGRRQALALTSLINCWRPGFLLCSPWLRCTETLRPYVSASGTRLRLKSGLSEDGHQRDPSKAHKHLQKLLTREDGGALCTHRSVLAALLQDMAHLATGATLDAVPDQEPYLQPAETMVAQVARLAEPAGDASVRIVSVERYTPL